jgi:3-deoxy-manno-octulosonate cytidylyltransferase (CMP-KDO synthetase)
MRVIVGIPARMGASRFPGKPLAKILGRPMVEHVYRRSWLAQNIDDVFVATCDEVIRQAVENFGGKAYMTPPEIERPGLRVAEVCRQLPLADDDIIVVVQGDEPLVHPGMVELAAQALLDEPQLQLGTLVGEATEAEWLDPDEVKVVADENLDILYMSRSPIPSNTRNLAGPRLKQVAIMPFRKKFLLDFQQLPPTPLEIAESVELLRAIEHRVKVRAIRSPYPNVSVDTEAGRREAEEAMKSDPVYPLYASR